jgi:gamma-glutamyltranspeptidase/glutathione hydrolase
MKYLAPALSLLLLVAPAAAKAPEPPFTAVVSAADPRATDAGVSMLRQGGNAMDAIAATLLALSVVEPQSSGIGGGGLLVYQPAKGGTPLTFDGREQAPMADTPELFIGPDGKPQPRREAVPGGKSVGVPGNIAMLAMAHAKLGNLPWAALFQPAIALARDGYEVTPRLARSIAGSAANLANTPEARALYLLPDGTPKPAGARIVNPALAATLDAVAKGGRDAFYTGPVAEQIVARVRTAPTNPALMTLEDLKAYKAKQRPPVCAPYRVWKLCTMGPPSAGGIAVLQILGQLQGFDLKTLGAGNPVSWHLMAESMRLAFADRAAYGGDADFVDVPVKGMVSAAYLKERGGLISADRTMKDAPAGRPPGAPARTPGVGSDVPSTSHFVAVDNAGNVATLTSTVEGAFGSSLVAAGMILNNELTDFSFEPEAGGVPVANRVQPGKRPRSSMSPTLVYDSKGQVVLAIGAAGGMTIPAQVAKAIIGVLDWQLPVEQAISLPQVYVSGDLLVVEKGEQGQPLQAMIPALEKLGHRTVEASMPLKANGAERITGGWRGGADPRSEGRSSGL